MYFDPLVASTMAVDLKYFTWDKCEGLPGSLPLSGEST